MAQLDRLAADIANVGTAGYKAERAGTLAAPRPDFGAALDSAVDVADGAPRVDFRGGALEATGRDLDVAIEGRGFFVVQSPAGLRYTRNGHFERRSNGQLVTADGLPVLGPKGPITLGPGAVTVEADGTIRVDGHVAGQFQVVDLANYDTLSREEAGRFRPASPVTVTPLTAPVVRGGVLEQSNVALPERMVELTATARAFEALQRGIGVMLNDLDGRAISEFGKR
jgi:flagellar basal body rod protein FlgG